ncbi:MAG: hypothetical protein O2819_07895 [Planctomycetota bacterium]|nr:hypothetical protein [Planctomycetota bacterium]MDA1106180.1 hypothetical protein [Planctomycetota bacterium]
MWLLAILAAAAHLSAQEARAQAAPKPIDFATQVQPILSARCYECHGNGKSKGKLSLDSKESVLRKRDGGAAVVPGEPDASAVVARVALPADDEDAMPPEGDRLTAEEQALLARWISEGASMPDRVVVPEASGAFALSLLGRQQVAKYADRLRLAGVIVEQRSRIDERLVVNASLAESPFDDPQIGIVCAVRDAVAELNLSRTAITEAGLQELSGSPEWPQLESIRLDGTAVTGVALPVLVQRAAVLRSINLHSTALDDAALLAMAKAAKGGSLRRVYTWNSKVTPEGVAAAVLANGELEVVLD